MDQRQKDTNGFAAKVGSSGQFLQTLRGVLESASVN
jgi:hypothetical protein